MTRPAPTAWRRAPSLSVEEAGRVLGVGRSRAHQLASEGRLPTYRDHFGRRRVRPAALEALLTDGGQPELFGGDG
jgi:excisionase family DNA binding protein